MTTSEIRGAIEAAAAGAPAVEGRSVVRTYRLAQGFLGFSGHFPGYPVLPGFIQLIIACAQAELVDGPLKLVEVETAKYHTQIHPGSDIVVTCACRTAERGKILDGKITLGDVVASAFTLRIARGG